jgi:hypothetical protein
VLLFELSGEIQLAPKRQRHTEETEPLGWRIDQADGFTVAAEAVIADDAFALNRKRPAGEAGRFWGYTGRREGRFIRLFPAKAGLFGGLTGAREVGPSSRQG